LSCSTLGKGGKEKQQQQQQLQQQANQSGYYHRAVCHMLVVGVKQCKREEKRQEHTKREVQQKVESMSRGQQQEEPKNKCRRETNKSLIGFIGFFVFSFFLLFSSLLSFQIFFFFSLFEHTPTHPRAYRLRLLTRTKHNFNRTDNETHKFIK